MDLLKRLKIPKSAVSNIYGASEIDKSEPFFIYTGKGLTDAKIHLGHYYVYKLIQKISKKEKAEVIFQLATDQKRHTDKSYCLLKDMFNKSLEFEKAIRIVAPSKRLILFDNLDPINSYFLSNGCNYLGGFVQVKNFLKIFGDLTEQKMHFWITQLAILLFVYQKINKKCIVITAEDQSGCFLLCRDLFKKLKIPKPVILVLKPIKGLDMVNKMSSSKPKNTVYFEEASLSEIFKAHSGADLKKNFCFQILKQFLLILNLKERKIVKALINKYLAEKKDLQLKKGTVLLFKDLLENKSKKKHKFHNLYSFLEGGPKKKSFFNEPVLLEALSRAEKKYTLNN